MTDYEEIFERLIKRRTAGRPAWLEGRPTQAARTITVQIEPADDGWNAVAEAWGGAAAEHGPTDLEAAWRAISCLLLQLEEASE